jgi:hypothetical protein
MSARALLLALVPFLTGVHAQQGKPASGARSPGSSQSQRQTPSHPASRYSPYAAAGGYSRQQPSFWEFWLHQLNPKDVNYGAWLEEKRRAFLRQAGANPYFWFAFAEFAAICFLVLCVAKGRIDRKDTEWEAASFMADLANYAEYCKQHATEAIQKHNEHIEVCNRVIEAADSGRPMPAGLQEDWRPEMERLRNELAEQVSENARVSAELAQKTQMVTSLSGRVDELARQMSARGNGGSNPNVDLVERVNRLTAELQAEREKNRKLRSANTA